MIVLVGIFILGSEYLILQLMKILGPRMIFRRLFNSATIHEYFVNSRKLKIKIMKKFAQFVILIFHQKLKSIGAQNFPNFLIIYKI